jgi:hypothetical protein
MSLLDPPDAQALLADAVVTPEQVRGGSPPHLCVIYELTRPPRQDLGSKVWETSRSCLCVFS